MTGFNRRIFFLMISQQIHPLTGIKGLVFHTRSLIRVLAVLLTVIGILVTNTPLPARAAQTPGDEPPPVQVADIFLGRGTDTLFADINGSDFKVQTKS